MPGDVGLVAKFLDTVMRWATDEQGYADWQLRQEISKWQREFKEGMNAVPRDLGRMDRALAELRRLRKQQGP